MIIDVATQLSQAIDKSIQERIELLPKSFPCKITKVLDDGVFVEVETLLKKGENDIPLTIPVMQSSYFKVPYQVGDIGLALNCSFLFDVVLDDRDIEKNIEALKNNALFFVPLVPKKEQKQTIEDLVLLNKNKDIKLSLKNDDIEFNVKDKITAIRSYKISTDLPIEQNGLIDISGVGGNLYSALNILLQLMDLLASGMNGSATTSKPYLDGKAGFIQALKKIIKE